MIDYQLTINDYLILVKFYKYKKNNNKLLALDKNILKNIICKELKFNNKTLRLKRKKNKNNTLKNL